MNTKPDQQPILKPGETIDEMGVRLYSEQTAQSSACGICGAGMVYSDDKCPRCFPESPAQNGGEKIPCFDCGQIGTHDIGCSRNQFSKPAPEPSSQQGEWKIVDSGFHVSGQYYVTIQANRLMFDIFTYSKEQAEATAKRIVEAVNAFPILVQNEKGFERRVAELVIERNSLRAELAKAQQRETAMFETAKRFEKVYDKSQAELAKAREENARLREWIRENAMCGVYEQCRVGIRTCQCGLKDALKDDLKAQLSILQGLK